MVVVGASTFRVVWRWCRLRHPPLTVVGWRCRLGHLVFTVVGWRSPLGHLVFKGNTFIFFICLLSETLMLCDFCCWVIHVICPVVTLV